MPKVKRERTRYHARPIDSTNISNRPFSVQSNTVTLTTSNEPKLESVNIFNESNKKWVNIENINKMNSIL